MLRLTLIGLWVWFIVTVAWCLGALFNKEIGGHDGDSDDSDG